MMTHTPSHIYERRFIAHKCSTREMLGVKVARWPPQAWDAIGLTRRIDGNVDNLSASQSLLDID